MFPESLLIRKDTPKSHETASNSVILPRNITAVVAEQIGYDADHLRDASESPHGNGVDHLLFNHVRVLVVVLRSVPGLKLDLPRLNESWADKG